MGYIYLRTNTVNGKKYVGQVITRRFKARQYKWACLSQPYSGEVINRARAKYGIDAFDFDILKECNDDELDYWEMYYIKELNTKVPYGYNMTDGGGGTSGYIVILTEEQKKKISEANKGKTPWNKGKTNIYSEETRKKISKAKKGKKLPPRSEEYRKKQSERQKGIKPSEKCLIRMIEAHKGKKLSEEHKKKISEALKGRKPSEKCRLKSIEIKKGKKLSEEHKKKLSESHLNGKCSKIVLQIDKETNEIIAEFPSVSEVKRMFNFNHGHIASCCRGIRKQAYGFIWRYKESVA